MWNSGQGIEKKKGPYFRQAPTYTTSDLCDFGNVSFTLESQFSFLSRPNVMVVPTRLSEYYTESKTSNILPGVAGAR